MRVNELIVVEGKDDVAAVKLAVDADVITTGGFGFKPDLVMTLKAAVKRTGVILFTDPDSAGNKIRRRLNELVPGCKNAYLPQIAGIKKNNIGIENASSEAIRLALMQARPEKKVEESNFCLQDLYRFGLAGAAGAEKKRRFVGNYLGIGETNAKQFLNRLNNQGIMREELLMAIGSAEED